MTCRNRRSALLRQARFESFEERLALSAQPAADFFLTTQVEQRVEMHFEQIEQHLEALQELDNGYDGEVAQHAGQLDQHLGDVHDITGVNYVHNTYGFSGAGQTVAVIDSGIAWDHVALGGGFGTGYRVVGGWDFAENDADPYDDGPSGFHGTHVAGIIGSSNSTYRGVSSDVNLVGLRVFDDNGAGYFSWVESALQWVHDHRNDFASPITTVNMSLGTAWNSDSIPNWSTIEDELAQLKQDGIFISVSAGNSFAEYNTPGLSYPAASQYVVPVASVTNAGSFSSFSQRHSRVIAAPGSSITSTVPDYVFGADGNPNDFGSASGTSMASPYVAGASVLIRQAMEFVGIGNVTQDTIYNHMRETADIFYDAATSASYHRLNVQAALDALMPEDDYGSSVNAAHDLGVLNGGSTFGGLIGTKADQDFFTFTAGSTGTIRFEFDTNHDLELATQLVNGSAAFENNALSFGVTAGSSYTFSLATSDGIGYYDANVTLEASFDPIDLGVVEFTDLENQHVGGETWYELQASRAGVLTIEAMFGHANGNIDVELYNSNLQQIATSASATNNERIDHTVAANDVVYLRVSGSNEDVDFRVTNLVSLTGSHLSIFGTAANDSIEVNLQSQTVTVNGVVYQQPLGESISSVSVDALGGQDELVVRGTDQDETATLRAGSVTVNNSTIEVMGTSVERIYLFAGAGNDRVTFYDTAGNDHYKAKGSEWATMFGAGYQNNARGFESTTAIATAGGNDDRATFYDTVGDDRFSAKGNEWAKMTGTNYQNEARGFDRVAASVVHAGGDDRATFYDTAGNDQYSAKGKEWATIVGAGYRNEAFGFSHVVAMATHGVGNDRVTFYDTAGDDHYKAKGNEWATMFGTGYQNSARGFSSTTAMAFAGGNDDRATFYDTAGDDRYSAKGSEWAKMTGANYQNEARGFDRVAASVTHTGGDDRATFYDTAGDDHFSAKGNEWATIVGTGYRNEAFGFELVAAFVTHVNGNDRVTFYDTAGNDHYKAKGSEWATMFGAGYQNNARGFKTTTAMATAGGNDDRATFYDTVGDDRYSAKGNEWAKMAGTNYQNEARGFDRVSASVTHAGGDDRAAFYDTAGDDHYTAKGNEWATIAGTGYRNEAFGFNHVAAFVTHVNGNDRVTFYDTAGDDHYKAKGSEWATMFGAGYQNNARGFKSTTAMATAGGNDRVTLYDTEGDDRFEGGAVESKMLGAGYVNSTMGFQTVESIACNGGFDSAELTGLGNHGLVTGRANWATVESLARINSVREFDRVSLYRTTGDGVLRDVEATDYVFEEFYS